MATSAEINLQPGMRVVSITAYQQLEGGTRAGIPINSPNAIVQAECSEVIALGVPSKAFGFPTNLMRVIWTTNPKDEHRIGSINEAYPGHRNYIAEGDSRLSEEMSKAGLRLKVTMDLQGNPVHEIVKIQE